METAVSFQGLSKHFGASRALDDVSFDVPRGALCGLIGPNGAGKTTLFSIAAGFLRPTQGTVRVLGVDVSTIGELCGRFSMLPQDAAFQRGAPVVEQLVMFARLGGASLSEARKQAVQALDLVGLREIAGRSAATLSHGMFKRVALCQAFIGTPEVVFLDEPTAGLDPDNARKMRDLMTSYHGDQTVMVSSHNLREIQDICDHIVVLHQGKLVRAASMAELTSEGVLLRISLMSELPDAANEALLQLPIVKSVDATSTTEFNVSLNSIAPEDKAEALHQIQKLLTTDYGLVIRAFHEGATLESKFLELTDGTYDGASGS